jgi:hypothetical protein
MTKSALSFARTRPAYAPQVGAWHDPEANRTGTLRPFASFRSRSGRTRAPPLWVDSR